jgi:hypothetical protein
VKCLWRGEKFEPRDSRDKQQKYCCPSHRLALHQATRRGAVREIDEGRLDCPEIMPHTQRARCSDGALRVQGRILAA